MRTLIAAAFFSFLAAPSSAQTFELTDEGPATVDGFSGTTKSKTTVYDPTEKDLKNVKGRDKRRAKRLIRRNNREDGQEVVWAQLTSEEQEAAFLLLARKVAEIRRQKGWKWVNSVEWHIELKKTDLETALADVKTKKAYDKSAKNKTLISDGETRTLFDPIEHILDGEAQPEIPPSVQLNNLFEDNQYEVSENKKEGQEKSDAQSLREDIDAQLAGMQPGDKLLGISIHSSASTLKSGAIENGKVIDNKRLSELRAIAARDFVLKYLAGKGITLPDPEKTVTIHAEGDNGNGTSGPNDPYGTGDKGNGDPLMKQKVVNGVPQVDADNKPIMVPDLASYAKFRYVMVTYVFFRKNEEPPKTVTYETKLPQCTAEITSFTFGTNEFEIDLEREPRVNTKRETRRQKRETRRDQRKQAFGCCPGKTWWECITGR